MLAGGAGLAYSSRARAQQRSSKSARIGIIDPTTTWDAFREELRNLGYGIAAKQLQLLREAVPSVARVAFLWNPDNA